MLSDTCQGEITWPSFEKYERYQLIDSRSLSCTWLFLTADVSHLSGGSGKSGQGLKLLSCPHCPHCSPGWGLWLAIWKWPYWTWHGLLSSLRSKSPADCTLFFTISLWRIGIFQEVSVIRRRWVRSDSSWANRKAHSVWPQGWGRTEGPGLVSGEHFHYAVSSWMKAANLSGWFTRWK